MEKVSDDLISFESRPSTPLNTDQNGSEYASYIDSNASGTDGSTSFGNGITKPLPILHELKNDEKQLNTTIESNVIEKSFLFMEGARKPLSPLHELEDLELEKLSQLCLPRWDSREAWRTESSAIRPERFEYTALLQITPSQAWKRAMQQLHSGFCRGRPLEEALPFSRPRLNRPFFGAMSIILYDIQLQKGGKANIFPDEELNRQYRAKMCTWRDLIRMVSKSGLGIHRAARPIFEHMLLVDYGMVAPRLRVYRSFSDEQSNVGETWKRDWPIWHALCAVVSEIAQSCAQGQPDKTIIWHISNYLRSLAYVSPARHTTFLKSHYEYDLALMLHHYHTHRVSLPPEEYWKGRTGYQGILQELIGEVPRIGTERLMRKLSVDVNENIDEFVSDRATRKMMKEVAKGVAARFGIELTAPKTRGLGTPLVELYYRNGVLKKEENP